MNLEGSTGTVSDGGRVDIEQRGISLWERSEGEDFPFK